MTTIEYRKRIYASTYADIIQNLTADNFADYFYHILNILCIPYNMECRHSSDYTDVVKIQNGDLIQYLNYQIDCIKITKGWLYGHKLTYTTIDISKSLILYDIMKLLCTTPTSKVHLQWYDSSYKTMTLSVNLLPDSILHHDTGVFRKKLDHITCVFAFNSKSIAPRLNTIKDALHKVYNVATITTVPTAPTPILYDINSESSNKQLPLAEAKIVA